MQPARARPLRPFPRRRRTRAQLAAPPSPGSAPYLLPVLLSIGARLGDERLKELLILPRLRMPEHADGEPPLRVLEPLDRAVVGPCNLDEAVTDSACTLVVMRLHRRAVAEDGAEPRAVVDLHAVLREDALHLAVLLATDDVRKMLDEVAAARNVQDLEAAADREHRHVACERAFEKRELAAVALGARRVRLRMRVGAVGLRIEIVATGKEQSVECVERL